jgi:uncharacterized membrane protein
MAFVCYPLFTSAKFRVIPAHGLHSRSSTLWKGTPAGGHAAGRALVASSTARGALTLRGNAGGAPRRPLQPLLAKGAAVLAALAVAISPLLGDPEAALAAQGGGRVGGSSFRAPTTRSAPPRSYRAPSGGIGGYYYSPAPVLPFTPFYFGPVVVPFGFTGIGTFLLAAAFFAFATRALSSNLSGLGVSAAAEDSELAAEQTTLVKLKVGLLSTARELQQELEEIALRSKTDSIVGLQQVLQETTLALYRNPDYWSFGSVNVKRTSLSEAEAAFNNESFAERGKLEKETLSNFGGQIDIRKREVAERDSTDMRVPEFIVVTLIVAASGRVPGVPTEIRRSSDIEAALRALSSIPREALQGVEVIWSPQSREDALTESEMLADHPELVRI